MALDLIYNSEKVRRAHDRLIRIVRLIFFREKITLEDFDELHRRQIMRFPKTQTQINSSLNNARRLLKEDKISWDKFQYLVVDILRYEIVDFRITVKNPETGLEMTISANDYVDENDVYHAYPAPDVDAHNAEVEKGSR